MDQCNFNILLDTIIARDEKKFFISIKNTFQKKNCQRLTTKYELQIDMYSRLFIRYHC